MAHQSQVIVQTKKSPATRPLPLATDDSLTKAGRRSLEVGSLRSLLKLRRALFLQTEGAVSGKAYILPEGQTVKTRREDEDPDWIESET